jgi:hypothetical protein
MAVYKQYVNKPPVGSQINWGHPLTNRLICCLLFNEGGGSKIINLAAYNRIVTFTPSANAFWYANGINFSGATGSATTAIISKYTAINDIAPVSYVVRAFVRGLGGNNLGVFFHKSGAGATSTSGVKEFYTLGTNTVSFRTNGSTDLIVPAASNTLTFNKFITWVITWTGEDVASSVHIYKNGIEVSYGATTNGSSLDSDAGNNLQIGDMGGNKQLNGIVSNFYLYNRILTVTEIKDLSKFPYQFITSPKVIKYFFVNAPTEQPPATVGNAPMTPWSGYWGGVTS